MGFIRYKNVTGEALDDAGRAAQRNQALHGRVHMGANDAFRSTSGARCIEYALRLPGLYRVRRRGELALIIQQRAALDGGDAGRSR